MSDTVASSAELPEVAYPPAVSLHDAWPWRSSQRRAARRPVLRRPRRGRRVAHPGPRGSRVGSRRATSPRLPLPLGDEMVRNLLICGLIAGLCGGLFATGFARVVGEGPVGSCDRVRGSSRRLPRTTTRRRRSSRAPCRRASGCSRPPSSTASRSAGCSRSRSRPSTDASAARAPRARASWLAAGAFVVVFLVPFVKYPANPPSVGDPDTIGKRTAVYLVMILVSLLAAVAACASGDCSPSAGRARRRRSAAALLPRRGRHRRASRCPRSTRCPKTFPAETLFRFREASIGMQAVLWTTIGLVFAATAQRVMTGQPIIPRRRPVALPAASD